MPAPSDYNRSFGGGALGARLRRTSERIDRLDDALDRRSMFDRILSKVSLDAVPPEMDK